MNKLLIQMEIDLELDVSSGDRDLVKETPKHILRKFTEEYLNDYLSEEEKIIIKNFEVII